MAFLATASLGAVWASCAPEFGARSVVDRFGQVEPTVLLAVGGLRLRRQGRRPPRAGGGHPRRPADRATRRPRSVRAEQVARRARPGTSSSPNPGAARLRRRCRSRTRCACCSPPAPPASRRRSCTATAGSCSSTCKNHGLSWDLRAGDRILWFSTTAWMMWNALVSSLLVRASIVMIDGNPLHPDLRWQWRLAAETGATLMGASPGVPHGLPQGGRAAGGGVRPVAAAADRRGGQPAAAGGLPVGGRAVRAGRPAERGQRRHRRVLRHRAGRPAAAGVDRRDLRPLPRGRRAGVRREGRTGWSASSASW